jgi:hypothetical protein
MKPPKHKEQPQQIQLELPDYSRAYYEYMQRKQQENKKQEESIVIIDIY